MLYYTTEQRPKMKSNHEKSSPFILWFFDFLKRCDFNYGKDVSLVVWSEFNTDSQEADIVVNGAYIEVMKSKDMLDLGKT